MANKKLIWFFDLLVSELLGLYNNRQLISESAKTCGFVVSLIT